MRSAQLRERAVLGQTCSEVDDETCAQFGGIFQGADTDCDLEPCRLPGACCVNDICFISSAIECAEFSNATYLEDGTTFSDDHVQQQRLVRAVQ